MTPRQREPKKRADVAEEVIEKLTPRVEPPPMSKPWMPIPYGHPIPFGEPPAEPVVLVEGEIPWELRPEQ